MYPLRYSMMNNNWGDAIAPLIFYKIAGVMPEMIDLFDCGRQSPHYLTCGSILSWANEFSVVWGSGFICKDDVTGQSNWRGQSNIRRAKPLDVLAVRGPLTRLKLLQLGISCPEIYGDPALLLPRLVSPSSKRLYDIGIVNHHSERDRKIVNESASAKVLYIDVFRPKTHRDLISFVLDITSCKRIMSSSLHGLVIADAYEIPSLWFETKSRLIGGHFKFMDYFASVGKDTFIPYRLGDGLKINECIMMIEDQKNDIKIDIQLLLEVCPFANGKYLY